MGNPHSMGPIQPGETVLDIGCGSGVDLLLAAKKVGPESKASVVDITEAMRNRTGEAAKTLELDHVDVLEGDATALLWRTKASIWLSRTACSTSDPTK